MDYSKIFHLISRISNKVGVTCVLIGGFAINYYKVTRQTLDVDFLVTKNDFEKMKPLLKEAGYKKDFSQKVFIRLRGKKPFLIDVDFMFVDEETIKKIIKDGKEINIVGEKFIVPSLNNLIALKLHSIKFNPKARLLKDLPDIVNLIKINKVDFKGKQFKELCLRYATKDIYNNILDALRE